MLYSITLIFVFSFIVWGIMFEIGALITSVTAFLSKILKDLLPKIIMIREAIKKGRTEAINEAYKENASRSKRAISVLMQPIKTGNDLVNSIRDRRNRLRDKK